VSTKIFVHRVYKEHKPDPVAMAQAIAAMEERACRQAKHAETKRIMSQLRCEELEGRAARLPAPTESSIDNMHCPYCWGMERAGDILGHNKKIMWRLYRGVKFNRDDLIGEDYLDSVRRGLIGAMLKQMRIDGVSLSADHIAQIVVRVVERAIKGIKEITEKPRTFEGPDGAIITAYPGVKTRIWTGPQLGGQCAREEIT
jgi:hypothetical protein